MAKGKASDTTTVVPKNGGPDRLETFLGLFQTFITELTNGARTTFANGDGIVVADALSATLQSQVIELNGFIRTEFNRMPTRIKGNVDQVLQFYSGETLLRAATPATQAPLTPGVAFGLSDIVHLIKKIIKKILELLGVQLGDWFWGLLDLIDEIINALFGTGFRELRTPLSVAEVNFLNELHALRRLEFLEQTRVNFEEDDEQ